jgi:tetratricopeptide (TPR) repeat protein
MAADEDARPETEEWKLQAEEFKSQGNEAFKQGSWKEAVEKYTQAIELDPEDKVYYSNRSAAYLKMGDAKSKALKDAEKCMKLDEVRSIVGVFSFYFSLTVLLPELAQGVQPTWGGPACSEAL